MNNTYVIGDVHGNLKTLKKLIEKIPQNSNIYFVGDLIDRGKNSKKVVEYIRKNNFKCVLGNHEELMYLYGEEIIEKLLKKNKIIPFFDVWLRNGGIETLISYNLIDKKQNIIEKDFQKNYDIFKNDIQWMKSLPIYIELKFNKNNKPIVISHASIGTIWKYQYIDKYKNYFRSMVNWNRQNPLETSPIFNIFGHTPTKENIIKNKNYINLDTGIYKKKDGYGKLSCYCIETEEVFYQNNID
jgi:serine/threonine protein phosphatase 1